MPIHFTVFDEKIQPETVKWMHIIRTGFLVYETQPAGIWKIRVRISQNPPETSESAIESALYFIFKNTLSDFVTILA